MMSDRKTALALGTLFLVVMISWSLGFWLVGEVIHADDFLSAVHSNGGRILLGILFELIDIAAVIGIVVLMFTLIERYSRRMALWYVIMRIMESVLLLVAILCPLTLILLSQAALEADPGLRPSMEALGAILIGVREDTVHLVLPFFYGSAAIVFFWFFYRTGLIPRPIAIPGLIAAVLVFAGIPMDFYDIEAGAFVGAVMGLVELFLGIWLIVKGFSRQLNSIDAHAPIHSRDQLRA